MTDNDRRFGQFGNNNNRRSALMKSKDNTSMLHDDIVSDSDH